MLDTLPSPLPALRDRGPGQDRSFWIVVVNSNRLDATRTCLRSIEELSDPASVIVVDNASTANPIPELKSEFSWIDAVRIETNCGWAGGNNVGVRHALARGAEWIVLLDNETTVAPRLVQRLREAANAHPEFGILAPVILRMDEPDSVQATGVAFNRPDRDGFFHAIDVPHHAQQLLSVIPCDVVNSCCLMIRRDVVEQIGLADERYFSIHGESDWCLRAQSTTKCGIVSDALVWHTGSSCQSREADGLENFYDTRNLVRLLRTHRGRTNTLGRWASFRQLVAYARHVYRQERTNGRNMAAQAVVDGLYDGLLGRWGPHRERSRPGIGLLRMAMSFR